MRFKGIVTGKLNSILIEMDLTPIGIGLFKCCTWI